MKPHLSLPPVCLIAGILAGHFIWPLRRDDSVGAKGLVRAVQASKALTPAVPNKVLAERPADPGFGTMLDFLERLEKTPAAEFPAFWEELEKLGNAGQNLTQDFSPQETLLAERWAELDPHAATAFFVGRGDLHPMVRTVFAVWSLADPDAALQALSGLSSPELRTTAAAGVFSAAADDPSSLIAWGRRMTFLDGREMKQEDFNAVIPPEAIRRAFDLDPAACQELAGRLPPWFRERLEALAILKEASTSLPSALARIDARGPGMDSAMHFFNEMLPLAESSPDKLLAITEHLTAKLGKGWLKSTGYTDLLPALTTLAKAAPDRVHGILAEAATEDPATDLFRTEAATAVFASDPRLALQIAPPGTSWLSDFTGGSTVFHGIAGTPQETLELVRTAPSSMMRDALMQDALATLGKESPEAAAAWVASLPPGELENAASVTIERPDASPMELDLTRAVASASTGGPDAASLERVRQLTKFAIQTDPSTVTGQLASWPEGAARDAAAQTAGKTWAFWSTPDALTWAESLPEGLKATAVSGVLEVWATAEPAAASEYIDAHQHDPERDIPVSAFARGLAEVDPAASLQWAATVNDASLRQAALEEIAAGWIKKNPEAARAGLLTIPGLTPAERQQLASPAAPK